MVIFFAAGLGLNPFIVGVVAGIGSAVGELTGYLIGLGGRQVIEIKRMDKMIGKSVKFFTKLFKKHGFWVIIITGAIPFPFDIIGILSGMGRYDIKKFFIATSIGKTIKTLLIAYAGYLAIPFLQFYLTSL